MQRRSDARIFMGTYITSERKLQSELDLAEGVSACLAREIDCRLKIQTLEWSVSMKGDWDLPGLVGYERDPNR